MAHVSPALASVFFDRGAAALWSKLKDDDPLSRLCSKYWGKIIEDEAEQWRRSHSTVDDPTNDIGPGCYVLDLGIKFLYPSKLWVRQDYIRIYDYCREEAPTATEDSRSVVITGQPGIGKSFWTTYAVRRRLGEQKPFLWYQDSHCYLFIEDGVYQRPVENVRGRDFVPFLLWAFIDADERESGIPRNLADHSTNLYIMFVTFPKRQRWKCLEKYTDNMEVVMNPWSLEEIRQAAKIHLTNEQQNLAEDSFKRFGPIPRICINFVRHRSKLATYESLCMSAIAHITVDDLRRFVFDGVCLNHDGGSDKIFMVRRNEVDNLGGSYFIESISANVEMELMTAINRMQRLDRINLYRAFASLDVTTVVAGLLYTSLGHGHLREGITLTLKPMIQSQQQMLFHSKSQGEGQASNSMDLNDSTMSIFFPPNTEIIYEGSLTSVQPKHLYVPKARSQVAFDSFFQLGAILYIFQFTVANNHDIKKGIEESLSVPPNMLPRKENWRLVFITRRGCEVDVKVKATSAVEEFLEGVTLYSAHFEIE